MHCVSDVCACILVTWFCTVSQWIVNTGRTQEGEEKPLGFGGLNEPLIIGGGIAWWSIATLVLYRLALLLGNERVQG